MKCVYTYKNIKFDSEIALDDFLLANSALNPKTGDIVFALKTAEQKTNDKLKAISDEAKKAAKINKQAIKEYNEEGAVGEFEAPYVGITSFLSGLTTDEGNIMFPEFRKNEYWKRRISDWKLNKYTEDEKAVLFETEETKAVLDNNQVNQYIELIEDKWEQQGVIGTIIHKVFQQCFEKDKNGNYYVDSLINNKNNIIITNNIPNSIKKYLESVNNGIHNDSKLTMLGRKERGRSELNYNDVINDKIIFQVIKLAKRLKDNLQLKYDSEDLIFLPEFEVVGNLAETLYDENKKLIGNKIRGTIDLLVVEPKTGKMHIVDYKTSPIDYTSSDYSSAKILTFEHQLATYNRILGQYGVDFDLGDMLVAPIQIKDFKRNDSRQNNKDIHFTYSGIKADIESTIYDDLTSEIKDIKENSPANNISSYLPISIASDEDSDKALENVSKQMKEWFTNYREVKKVTKEEIIEELKSKDLLKKNEEGFYVYVKENGLKITSDNEVTFVNKIYSYENTLPKKTRLVSQVTKALSIGIKNNNASIAQWPFQEQLKSNGEASVADWFKVNMEKYCNNSWEIIKNPILSNFGIIAVRNKYSQQIDIIKLSKNTLANRHVFEYNTKNTNRTGLIGKYELDIQEKSKSNSLMLDANKGNVELMETLLVLNNAPSILRENSVIGNILVANPREGSGMQASNEELLYCYKALNKYSKVDNDLILNGKIKFATKYELVYDQFLSILASNENENHRRDKRFDCIESARSVIEAGLTSTNEGKIKALEELAKRIENNKILNKNISNIVNPISTLNDPYVILYNNVIMAIADLKGISFRQQTKDHDRMLESSKIFSEGLASNLADNPGNLKSETLNLLAKLVLEAYQNVRQDMQEPKYKYHQLVENLKKEKGFYKLQEYTFGNQVKLYSDMIEHTPDGNIRIKNIKELKLKSEREFAKFFLYHINKNRLKKSNGQPLNDDELAELEEKDSIKYYQLPLQIGSMSTPAVDSFVGAFKTYLKRMTPAAVWERTREKFEGFDRDEERAGNDDKIPQIIYKMSTSFDSGESTKRLDIIKDKGFDYFEHNLETIGLKHIFSYSIKENIDNIFPMIKAAVIHLNLQGSLQNTNFSGDLRYISDYVNANIKNANIIGKQYVKYAKGLNYLKQAASITALAFSPVQGIYQNIQGFWNDISLMYRKPDGRDSFTFQHLKDARLEIYKDIFKNSAESSVCSEINELYGMNDMDMNTYSERIQSDRHGIFHLNNLMFKFASRPDYYNRGTLFGAQMRGDGCWEAHSIKDNKLVYDWTKDKRFDAFANNKINDPKYNEQKALYYAMAKQFINEGTKYLDGTPFVLDLVKKNPLPRAYTNQQAEGMKAIADKVYGYYSHEKKSLVHATLIGTLWMQFRTYWSSKKNQYLGSPGVKMQGKMVPYKELREIEENGQKIQKQVQIYYKLNKDGLPTEEMTEEDTGFKVYQWEGDWEEGILITLATLLKSTPFARKFFKSGSEDFKTTWHYLTKNPDMRLRTAYLNNLKQLLYDIIMFFVGGILISESLLENLYDDLEDNSNKKDALDGLKLSAAKIAVYSVQNSFQDFNFLNSISDPLTGWTPFSFEWAQRMIPKIWRMLPIHIDEENGTMFNAEEDIWDVGVTTFAATKQIKPFLDAIKPEFFKYDEDE